MDAQSLVSKFLDLTKRPKWSVEMSASMVRAAKERKQKELELQQESSQFSKMLSLTNRPPSFMRAVKFVHRRAKSLDKLFVVGGSQNPGEVSIMTTARSNLNLQGPQSYDLHGSLTDRNRSILSPVNSKHKRVAMSGSLSTRTERFMSVRLPLDLPATRALGGLKLQNDETRPPDIFVKKLGAAQVVKGEKQSVPPREIDYAFPSARGQHSTSQVGEESLPKHAASGFSSGNRSYLAMRTSVQKAYIHHRRDISDSIFAQTGKDPDLNIHLESDHKDSEILQKKRSLVEIGTDQPLNLQPQSKTKDSPHSNYLSLKSSWRIPKPLFDRAVRIKL